MRKKIESKDPRLARHINHDDRSWNYKLDTTNIEIKDVEHKRLIPVLNQGQLGSCTGNAGIGALNTEPFTLNNKIYSPDETGAVKLYSDATKIDRWGGEYPPTDTGSSGLAIAKVLKRNGLISEYKHTFTINDALKALTIYPLLFGVNWHKDMYNPDPDGRVHITGEVVGGHEIQAFKIDKENMKVWFYNSWGKSWGVEGTFYLTWADLAILLSERGDVVVLVPPKKEVKPVEPKKKYKHFSQKEVDFLKVSPELMSILDTMRDVAGTPFIATSGLRTPQHNKEVGGKANSSHLKGLAVDLRILNNKHLTKMLNGISEIRQKQPVFLEITKSHLHIDIDSSIHSTEDTIVV